MSILGSVECAECRKCRRWKMRSVENAARVGRLYFKQLLSSMRRPRTLIAVQSPTKLQRFYSKEFENWIALRFVVAFVLPRGLANSFWKVLRMRFHVCRKISSPSTQYLGQARGSAGGSVRHRLYQPPITFPTYIRRKNPVFCLLIDLGTY